MRHHQQGQPLGVYIVRGIEPARPGRGHVGNPFLLAFIAVRSVFIAQDNRVLDHIMFAVLLHKMHIQPFRQFRKQICDHVFILRHVRVLQQLPVFGGSQSERTHFSQQEHGFIPGNIDNITFVIPFQIDPQFFGRFTHPDIHL